MGELLFIGSCAGNFYAFNKTTGEVQWSYDIRQDGKQQSFHGDPLVTGDLILIGTDQSCDPEGVGHVYAFERHTGKVHWKHRSTSVPTDIVQSKSNVFFGSFQDKWSSVDLRTGRLNWSFPNAAPNENCDLPKSPVAVDNSLFVIGLDGVIHSLDPSSGRVVWKRKLTSSPSTGLALRDKTIYVGTMDQRIYRLNAKTGTVISELTLEAKPVGRLGFANDSLLMFLENVSERVGYIISVDSKLAGVRWRQKSSPEWASERPHLWGDFVVAGNCRGGITAFRIADGVPQWNLSVKGCIRTIGSSGDLLFVGVQEGTIYAYGVAKH